MKKNRSIIAMAIALVVIIVVFVVAMIWQNNRPDPDETGTTTERPVVEPLVSVKRDEVSELIIVNENGTVRIANQTVTVTPTPAPTPDPTAETEGTETDAEERTEERWVLLEPEIEAINQGLVDATGNGLLTFTIVEDITGEAAENLENYGINEPQAEVTYVMKDGSERVIQLGNQLQGETRYYAYDETSERLVVVTSPSTYLLRNPTQFVSAQIFPFEHVNLLTGFSFERKSDGFATVMDGVPYETTEDSEEAEVTEPTEVDPSQLMPPVWEVTVPFEWKANQTNIPELQTELLGLNVTEQIALTQDDLNQYGLVDPEYTIVLAVDDEEVTLSIGSARGDGTSFAKATGIDGVFTINTSALTRIGMAPIEFFDGFVALESVWTVERIEADLDGKELDIEIFSPSQAEKDAAKEAEEEEPRTIYIVNGRNANVKDERDRNYFSTFYQHLIGVMGRGLDLEADPELQDPQFSFTILKRDDSEDVSIDLVSRNDRTWYIFRNGEYTGFYTDYSDLFGYQSRDKMGLMASLYRLENAIAGQQSGYYEHPPIDPQTGETIATDETTEDSESGS